MYDKQFWCGVDIDIDTPIVENVENPIRKQKWWQRLVSSIFDTLFPTRTVCFHISTTWSFLFLEKLQISLVEPRPNIPSYCCPLVHRLRLLTFVLAALQSPEDETVRKNTFRLLMNHRHSKSRQITWHTADHEHEMVKKETRRAALCRCHRRAMGSVSRPIAMFSASRNSASE